MDDEMRDLLEAILSQVTTIKWIVATTYVAGLLALLVWVAGVAASG